MINNIWYPPNVGNTESPHPRWFIQISWQIVDIFVYFFGSTISMLIWIRYCVSQKMLVHIMYHLNWPQIAIHQIRNIYLLTISMRRVRSTILCTSKTVIVHSLSQTQNACFGSVTQFSIPSFAVLDVGDNCWRQGLLTTGESYTLIVSKNIHLQRVLKCTHLFTIFRVQLHTFLLSMNGFNDIGCKVKWRG